MKMLRLRKLGGSPFTGCRGEKYLSISTPGCASGIWAEVQAGRGRRQQRASRALSKWTVEVSEKPAGGQLFKEHPTLARLSWSL